MIRDSFHNGITSNYIQQRLLENAELTIVQLIARTNEDIPFIAECDASDIAVSASLNQNGKSVVFLSKTLSGAQRHYPAVENLKF